MKAGERPEIAGGSPEMPGGCFAGAGGSPEIAGGRLAGAAEHLEIPGEDLAGAGGSTKMPGELSAGLFMRLAGAGGTPEAENGVPVASIGLCGLRPHPLPFSS
ncbi:MAG TPA: hypothetical protein VGG20_17145 [Thermoanaerobaculia bacterium]